MSCPFHMQQLKKSMDKKVNLKMLSPTSYLDDFDYAKAFQSLDLDAVRKDIEDVMTTSQPWWPADYGHYGPLFVRLAWHSAGTYRIFDGRGGANSGNIRFAPLNSWPDNANLDKARRVLWPVKQKYGKALSWGDLIIFAGIVAIEHMGLKDIGFAGGRVDAWAPEDDVDWGDISEDKGCEAKLAEDLQKGLGAVVTGLIYVNPEGPGGDPDPLKSALTIRETFRRMAMNDEETVALIAGGHTFGKAHGAHAAADHVGPPPESATLEEQGFGWKNTFQTGKGSDTITSGLEGAWTANPTKWDHGYFHNLFSYEWVLTTSPAGAKQWTPAGDSANSLVPDAHDPEKRHAPMMFTSDLALKMDPVYGAISKRFFENPDEFAEAFKKAWYKLCHRDMGPVTRCLGSLVPPAFKWQDPLPPCENPNPSPELIENLKQKILDSGLPMVRFIAAAWASAATFRRTDFRGGANGARVTLLPQKDWAVNEPVELEKTLNALRAIQADVGEPSISMADLIVLAGCTAVEHAAKLGGAEVSVPFTPGRSDATQEDTDIESFSVLEPSSDGFRNFRSNLAELVDRAHLLSLTAPEMTVLLGGLRVLGCNADTSSSVGVLTKTPGVLTNDFFVNLLDMRTSWAVSSGSFRHYEGRDLASNEVVWKASAVDLAFGSNSELRAIAEYYACEDAKNGTFVKDFIAAWNKVMMLDRFA